MWAWFADHCQDDSPLYGRISAAVADDPGLLAWVRSAPPAAHLPPALLAAVHYLLLEDPDHPLADVYAGRVAGRPGPAVPRPVPFAPRRGLAACWPPATSRPTTAVAAPSSVRAHLAGLAARPNRWPLVDVGASAGLNLLCDRYRIDYGARGTTGPAGSPVHIACRVDGRRSADRRPSSRPGRPGSGIDRSPVDLTDPDDARWLAGLRLARYGSPRTRPRPPSRLAQADPPPWWPATPPTPCRACCAACPEGAAAVVVTTWAFAYFSTEDRQRFVDLLARRFGREDHRLAAARKSLGTVAPLAAETDAGDGSSTADVLGAMTFFERRGGRQPTRLCPRARAVDRLAEPPDRDGRPAPGAPDSLTSVRVGLVILPTDRWPEARRQWEWADQAGFATAWTYDHIRWGGMPDGPWHAAVPVLAAAAAVTVASALGTLVATPNFRHPVTLARDVIALDDLSAGRFDLGVGPGQRGPRRLALWARSPGRQASAWTASPSSSQSSPILSDDDARHRTTLPDRALCGRRGAQHPGHRADAPPPHHCRRRADRASAWPPPTASNG